MKKNRNEDEWRKLIADQKRSGQTVPNFCRKHGINSNVFYAKRKRLMVSGFVKLPIPVTQMQCDSIKIRIGDVAVEASPACSPAVLASIIRSIREVVNA